MTPDETAARIQKRLAATIANQAVVIAQLQTALETKEAEVASLESLRPHSPHWPADVKKEYS